MTDLSERRADLADRLADAMAVPPLTSADDWKRFALALRLFGVEVESALLRFIGRGER